MSYEITYTDHKTGKPKVHTFSGNQTDAEGWAHKLSQENDNCVATIEDVDHSGGRKYVGGVGDKNYGQKR